MSDILTDFPLSEPIKGHDGEITVLKLKAPRARSFMRHGMPFILKRTVDKDGLQTLDTEYNPGAMMSFAEDMTGIDGLILQSMHGYDTYKLFITIEDIIGNPPKRGD